MSNEARRPRGYVKLNGQTVPVLAFRTVENSHFQCDTFEFTLGLWPDGLEAWGGDNSGIMAEVLLGFLQPGDDPNAVPPLDSLLIGEIDDVDADTIGGTITLTGRDLTGRLIDNKVSETWPDRTASEIVSDLASKAGLAPQVTATKTPVGKYAKDQYAALGRDIPVWDLITTLAQAEGFDAYVKGTTLYFGPPEDDDGDPLEITLRGGQPITGSVLSLHLKRSLTLAKDIVVTVISYSARKKAPIEAVAKRQGAQKAASTSFRTGKTSQNYTIRKAGLTQGQADALAMKTLKTLSQHERTFSATLVPDTTTRSRGKASITGTDSGWDTSYFVDTVTRDFSSDGLTLTVTAKNHDIESQAA